MSRIGKKPIAIPDKTEVKIIDRVLKAKGPKGTLEFKLPEPIEYNLENKILSFTRPNDMKHVRALHGLTRALSANVIEGVSTGFSKTLIIEGVGYKVELKGKNLLMSLGFSHPIMIVPPDDILIETPNQTTVVLKGIDKQAIGEFAARIRKIRKPEPYKGKGIRYQGEYIRRKAGKTSSK